MKVKVRGATEVDVKKLNLNRSDIAVVMRPKYMNQDKWDDVLTALANDIANYLGYNIMVIGCDRKWNEIAKLDEKQMALYNWVPRDKVLAMKSDPLPEIIDKVKELADLSELDLALRAKFDIDDERARYDIEEEE